jgi:hypothetical protein
MLVRNWSGAARYGLPGLILGVALAWVGGARGPEAAAQTGHGVEPPRSSRPGLLASEETGGTMAFVTQPSGTSQWLYVIDTKARAFAVYRVDPNNPKGVVKLEAARQYQYDLKLEHYNNQPPEPSAIKEATLNGASQPGRPTGDR